MFCEEIKIPGLPGEGTVTDGSVDWYEMDWENVDNGVTEEQMPRNVDKPCTAQDPCTDNSPVQTDDETYEIVQEPEANSAGAAWLLPFFLIWEKFPGDRGQASRKMTQA